MGGHLRGEVRADGFDPIPVALRFVVVLSPQVVHCLLVHPVQHLALGVVGDFNGVVGTGSLHLLLP